MGNLGERIFTACAVVCTRHRWLVMALTLVLTVLAGYASTGMKVNTSTEGVLSNDLRFRQVEINYRKAFPREEAALVIIDAPTPREADSAADNLAVRLRARSDLFTNVRVPGTSPFFTDNGLLYLAPDKLDGFLSTLDRAAPALRVFESDPSLRGLASVLTGSEPGSTNADSGAARLFSELGDVAAARAAGDENRRTDWVKVFDIQRPEGRPGTRRFVLATPVLDNNSLNRAGPSLDALHEEIEGMKTEEAKGTRAQVTGEPVLSQQQLSDSFDGAILASGLSFILVAISLVLGLRSGRLILVLLATIIIGGIWTTGLAAVFVGRLNLISVAFMVLFVGLGVDFGTHLGLRFMEERKKGQAFERAMALAMVGEGPAIGLSTLCAIVAFLSFLPTAYTALAEFGVISALGMVVAFVMTFTVQPAMMALMPPKLPKRDMPEFGVGNWIRRHYRSILIASLVVTAGALYAAKDAQIDTNPLNLQNQQAEPVIAYKDLADDPQTSPYSANVVADNLEDARRRAARLAQVPGVAHVMTVEDFLPADQPQKLQRLAATRDALGASFFNADAEPAPDDAALVESFNRLRGAAAGIADAAPEGAEIKTAAARLRDGLNAFAEQRGTDPAALRRLQEGLVSYLPELTRNLRERLARSQPLTIADLPQDIARDWVAPDGRMRLQAQPATDIGTPEGFTSFTKDIQAVEPDASGVPISVEEAGNAIEQSFAEAVIYTVLAIALIVLLMRRNLYDLVLIMAPLAVAAIWTVAGSALLNLPFNFANVIVIPLLIGLGVAGSVHIVVRAREIEHERGGTMSEDVPDVLETSTSLAVLVAQLNTVAAFATLAVSHHQGLYSMGMLLGLSILLVVIICLVVLPAALIAINRWSQRKHAGA